MALLRRAVLSSTGWSAELVTRHLPARRTHNILPISSSCWFCHGLDCPRYTVPRHTTARHAPWYAVALTDTPACRRFCHGLDCPQYSVVDTTDAWEEREYAASTWVTTEVQSVLLAKATTQGFMVRKAPPGNRCS